MKGTPTRAIQELAGHQDLITTQRHMYLSPAAVQSAIGCWTARREDILETSYAGGQIGLFYWGSLVCGGGI